MYIFLGDSLLEKKILYHFIISVFTFAIEYSARLESLSSIVFLAYKVRTIINHLANVCNQASDNILIYAVAEKDKVNFAYDTNLIKIVYYKFS